jgi:hypothetical protein
LNNSFYPQSFCRKDPYLFAAIRGSENSHQEAQEAQRKNYFVLNYFAKKICGSKKQPFRGALALKK